MNRLLITGATGFTGGYLARELAAAGYEVHGLGPARPKAEVAARTAAIAVHHVCDLLDRRAVTDLVAEVAPTKVVHLAAIASVGHADVDLMYRTNIVGSRNLLSALAEIAAPPKLVLLASSANVYGNVGQETITERTEPVPANDYAVSKLAMEYMARIWMPRLPIVVVRPFNYTGCGQSEDFVLPKLTGHFKRRESVLELGNIDVERDFSDVRTVVDCYRRLLEVDSAGRTVNICSGVGHTLRQAIDVARDFTGHSPEIRINPAFVRPNDIRRLVGSRQLLEQLIGSVRGPSFEDTLKWMMSA
jgi:nucleoside-diphosphate-sugar epimerase